MSRRQIQLETRDIGPATILGLVIAFAVLWLIAWPEAEDSASYAGQFLGAEATLLMSISLVLVSALPFVEGYFDGMDRATIWHRRTAMAGLVLLLPHLLLSAAEADIGMVIAWVAFSGLIVLVAWSLVPRWRLLVPRAWHGSILWLRDTRCVRWCLSILGGYERWQALHRTTGLFVGLGVYHAWLDATPFDAAPVLRWTLLAVGIAGVGCYLYRELLARFFMPLHDYQVDAVNQVGQGMVEISLRPRGLPMRFVPGQFAMLYLKENKAWHRHPFTIASAAADKIVRVTVKELGDYTSRLHSTIEPGMPAVIGGPHGRFCHDRGTDRQVWIAGGVGVAPFLSWIRSLDQLRTRQVDFFYSFDGQTPFAEEIKSIAAEHDGLRVHLVDSKMDGRLTAAQVLSKVEAEPADLSVFMCGPTTMLQAFHTQLRRAGVRSRRMHREYFDWR